uniref:Uncharacterized protein n=1 Tax=Rangifer tarandus platyrhynchus TaxID=3082113 RepID=A0ACB0FL27_RANTA|nr:unnamed protein product [Rangifer tarandus platyrhynchus]
MPSRSDQTDTRNTWGSEHHGRPPPPRTHAPSPPSLGPLGSEPPSTCFPEDSVSSQVSHEASWRETLTTAQHGDWVYVTELFHLSVVRQQSFTQKRQRLWRASLSPPHGGGPGTKLGARCVGSLALRQPVPGTGLGSKEYGPVPGLLTGATGPSEDRALRIWGETEARLKVGAGPAWRKCLPGRRPGRVPGQEAGTSVNRSSVPATTSGLGERRRLPARFPANVGPDNGPLCPVWAGCQGARPWPGALAPASTRARRPENPADKEERPLPETITAKEIRAQSSREPLHGARGQLNARHMWLLGGQQVCHSLHGPGLRETRAGSSTEGLRRDAPGCSFSS